MQPCVFYIHKFSNLQVFFLLCIFAFITFLPLMSHADGLDATGPRKESIREFLSPRAIPEKEVSNPAKAFSHQKISPALVQNQRTSQVSRTGSTDAPVPDYIQKQEIGTQTLQAFQETCSIIGKKSRWQPVCQKAQAIPVDDQAAIEIFFRQSFSWSKPREGLLTGYYQPIIEGQASPSEAFSVPVYGVPTHLHTLEVDPNWKKHGQHTQVFLTPAPHKRNTWSMGQHRAFSKVKGVTLNFADFSHLNLGRTKKIKGRIEGDRFVPFYDRAEIQEKTTEDSGWLNAPVLAWLHDPADLFFMQIQGSGVINLDDGRFLQLGFADHNGHPYSSIAKALVTSGSLSTGQVSMQTIRAWMLMHPDRVANLMAHNRNFVFFRILSIRKGEYGAPHGAMGRLLTAGYSMAVDPQFIPLGSPVWIESTLPSGQILRRLVVAQDTGSAIKGVARGDLFVGTGPEAGHFAGRLKNPVFMRILKPKTSIW